MRFPKILLFVMFFFTFLFSVPFSQEKAAKKALVIGINEYSADPGRYNLEGCENDADMIKQLLIYRYNFEPRDIKVIKSRNATLNDIRREMNDHLIRGTKPGDLVVFYYSGHGTRVPDANGDEEDGYDEALCPSDALPTKNNAKNVLIDDEFGEILRKIPTENLVVILDCCFSGTAYKSAFLLGKARFMTPGDGKSFDREGEISSKKEREINDEGNPTFTFISACSSWEKAQESRIDVGNDEIPCGLLTKNLYKILDQSPGQSYSDAFTAIKRKVVEENPAQTPTLEGKLKDGASFQLSGASSGSSSASGNHTGNNTGNSSPGEARVLAPSITEVRGSEALINKGAAGGVTAGSVFGVYSPGDSMKDPSSKVGAIEIQSVESLQSRAMILNGRDKIAKGCAVKEESHSFSRENLMIKYDQFPGANAIQSQLKESSHIDEASGNILADRIIGPSSQGGLLAIYAPDGTLLQDFKGTDIREILPDINRSLDSAYVMKRLSALNNPNPSFTVKLALDVDKTRFRVGEEIGFNFKTDADCYLILVHVSSGGEVSLLFPNKYAKSNQVRSGQVYEIPPFENGKFLFRYRLGTPTGQEMVKAIATKAYVDPWGIDMSNLQGVFKSLKGDPVELADNLFLSLNKLLSGQKPMSVEQVSIPTSGGTGGGWATDSLTYVIEEK